MRVDRHFFRLLGVALTLAVAACGSDTSQPTAAISPEFEISSQALEATLNAERVRTANEALASVRVYDSLMTSYNADLVGGLVGGFVNTVNSVLLTCRPLPYASDAKSVGSAGGTLRIGPHTLVIPPGALSQNTVITAQAPSSKYAQVTFSPHGLQFNDRIKPVLTLSYSHCTGLLSIIKPKIVYVDNNLKILETLLSLNLSFDKSVSAPLSHFSSYMVAY